MRHLEVPVRTCTLSVDDALWNAFAVEVGKQIDGGEILQ
jgi:hypothetical protein